MEPEIQTEIQKTFETFKSYVDKELLEIKKTGAADPGTAEAVVKLNARLDELAAKNGRPASVPATEAEQKSGAVTAFLRKGWDNMSAEQKAMSVGSDPDGGYLVEADENGPMVKKMFDTTPMRQVAEVVSISTDALEGEYDRDEATIGWVGETTARTETATPVTGKYRIETHEMYAEPRITQKLLDDAKYNVELWLQGKVSDKFSRGQNDAFINGNGVTKPRGLATYTTAATADASRTWGQMEHIATGVSANFAASTPTDQIFDLVYALKAGYRTGASFMMPKAVLGKIRKFKETTTNAYIWQPGLQAGQPSKLLDYPLVESEDMPALAGSSLSMAFGNFKRGYLIVDRLGIRVLRDPYTAKPYVKFYTTARVGGAVVDFEAIKFMKFI